jgi:hypothetical protein
MKQPQIQRAEAMYALLLKLYPTKFRQQFGDEMRFVFAESVCDAYEQAGGKGVIVLWGRTIIDLGKSLLREHVENQKGRNSMTARTFINIRSAALIGLLMVLPFMLLEAITTSGFARAGFPFGLFIFMWLSAAVFALILLPIVRTIRAGSIATANPLFLTLGVILMALIAWEWVGIVIDQMPCFLGVPNCD